MFNSSGETLLFASDRAMNILYVLTQLPPSVLMSQSPGIIKAIKETGDCLPSKEI